jgi:5-(carboxyamino)imidazole ribonucleotide synthase
VGRLTTGAFDDCDSLLAFAADCDFITYEFENVPVRAAETLNDVRPVMPHPNALRVSQHRAAEKQFIRSHGIDTAPFVYPIATQSDLTNGLNDLGGTAVLKTCTLGYDGKGQRLLRTEADAISAWGELGGHELILEGFVEFDREVSLIAARTVGGDFYSFPLSDNVHRDGILRCSTVLLRHSEGRLQSAAKEYVQRLMVALNYVGVLAVEFFVVGDRLVANEIAPRVHNTGHWTIDGAFTSQFEAHIRAISNMPLAPLVQHTSSVMVNIVGELPNISAVMKLPGTHLHLYDKAPRPGRKLGHVTVCLDDIRALAETTRRLESITPWVVNP